MKTHKFKGVLFFLVVSIGLFSCQLGNTQSEESDDSQQDEISAVTSDGLMETELSDYNDVESLGMKVFSFLKTLDKEKPKAITKLMPDFKTCKDFYYKKRKSKSYSIESYDRAVSITIENLRTYNKRDTTINWSNIEFRDFSYASYQNGSNEVFGMVATSKSTPEKADFIEGWLNFKEGEQNYKVKVFGKELLGKWYLIRLENLKQAFTY